MKETKHTPGPWDASENIDYRIMTDVTARAGEDLIADCGLLNGLSANECVANARLIAAAPELLEALKAITQKYAGQIDNTGHYDGGIFDKARVAIAKAEGRAE